MTFQSRRWIKQRMLGNNNLRIIFTKNIVILCSHDTQEKTSKLHKNSGKGSNITNESQIKLPRTAERVVEL